MSVTESIFKSANSTLAALKTWIGGATADGYDDEEPVHDATTDIPAAVFNKHTAGPAENALRIRPGNVVVVTFGVDNLAAGLTDSVLNRMHAADVDRWIAGRGCCITDVIVFLQNAVTAPAAPTAAVAVELQKQLAAGGGFSKIADYSAANSVDLDDTTNTQKNRRTANPIDAYNVISSPTVTDRQFAALDELRCVVTTDASFAAGATPSLTVDVYISIDGAYEAI